MQAAVEEDSENNLKLFWKHPFQSQDKMAGLYRTLALRKKNQKSNINTKHNLIDKVLLE